MKLIHAILANACFCPGSRFTDCVATTNLPTLRMRHAPVTTTWRRSFAFELLSQLRFHDGLLHALVSYDQNGRTGPTNKVITFFPMTCHAVTISRHSRMAISYLLGFLGRTAAFLFLNSIGVHLGYGILRSEVLHIMFPFVSIYYTVNITSCLS
jgi:hypothetical protein